MADAIYVAVIVAFFALSALFVHACDRVIGAAELTMGTHNTDEAPGAADREVAA